MMPIVTEKLTGSRAMVQMLFPAAYCFRYFMVFSPGMTGWQPHVRTRSVLFYQKNPRLSMKIHIQKENQRTG